MPHLSSVLWFQRLDCGCSGVLGSGSTYATRMLTVDWESPLGRLHSSLLFPCNTQNHLILNSNSLSEKPHERALISNRSPKCTRLHILKPVPSVRAERSPIACVFQFTFSKFNNLTKDVDYSVSSRAKICQEEVFISQNRTGSPHVIY